MKRLNPNTLVAKVATYLKTGHSLDIPKATAMFGIFRLPVAVQALRKRGFDVRTQIAVPPDGKEFAVYTLPKTIDKDTRTGTLVRVSSGDRAGLTGKVGTIARHVSNDEQVQRGFYYECTVVFASGTPFFFKYNELEPEYLNAE